MRALLILLCLAMATCAAACTHSPDRHSPTHNAAGGYADACGDLPGLIGDDC